MMLPYDSTKIFTEIFEDYDDFIYSWKESGFYEDGLVKDENIKKIYFSLYAKHANSAIANMDENQFKYKLFYIIFTAGPTWEKKLEIQKKLRNLDDEELLRGSKTIYNHSYNPSTMPSTSSLEELPTVNDQTTTNNKKSKIEGYALLLELLETDVTTEFISKFSNLFAKFVHTRPVVYVSEEEGD